MIQPGTYVAKATAIRFVKPKNTLGLEVRFQFKNQDGGNASLNWVGWCSDGALKNTMRTLVTVLEYDGDEEIVRVDEKDPNFGMLKNQDCINRKKDVQLVIEMETYDGKDYPKIKWVNEIGGGQFSGASPEVVKNDLNAVGFKAAFLAIKQGKKTVPTPAEANAQREFQSTANDMDVPF